MATESWAISRPKVVWSQGLSNSHSDYQKPFSLLKSARRSHSILQFGENTTVRWKQCVWPVLQRPFETRDHLGAIWKILKANAYLGTWKHQPPSILRPLKGISVLNVNDISRSCIGLPHKGINPFWISVAELQVLGTFRRDVSCGLPWSPRFSH